MKKLLLTLVALVAAMSMSAQFISVMKGDQVVKIFSTEEADKFIFSNIPIPQYVDLGLPSGLKWATFNVGASKPEEAGLYFAWGDTKGYSATEGHDFSWANCPFNNGSSEYNATYFNSVKSTVCPDGTLASDYDAATANLGDVWRMPTYNETNELINNCYIDLTDNYKGTGVKGVIIYKAKTASDKGQFKNRTGYSTNSDIHIFLPDASYIKGTELYTEKLRGDYWVSSLSTSESQLAGTFSYHENNIYCDFSGTRYIGRTVRAVKKN